MANNVKLQWIVPAGWNKLRHDPNLVGLIEDECARVAERAGRGFDWKSRSYPSRHVGLVYTGSARAMVVNQTNNTLLKALGGG